METFFHQTETKFGKTAAHRVRFSSAPPWSGEGGHSQDRTRAKRSRSLLEGKGTRKSVVPSRWPTLLRLTTPVLQLFEWSWLTLSLLVNLGHQVEEKIAPEAKRDEWNWLWAVATLGWFRLIKVNSVFALHVTVCIERDGELSPFQRQSCPNHGNFLFSFSVGW